MIKQKKISKSFDSIVRHYKEKMELDQKIDYYNAIIEPFENLYKAIENKIEELNKENISNEDLYKKCKLEIEKVELKNTIFAKNQFKDMWLKRAKDWEIQETDNTKEVNENFDTMLSSAKDLGEKNLNIKTEIENFLSKENVEQVEKNTFYFYLKSELNKQKTK